MKVLALLTLATILAFPTPANAAPWRGKRVTVEHISTLPIEQVVADWNTCGVVNLELVNRRPDITVTYEDFGYTPDWIGQGTQIINQRGVVIGGRVLLNKWWFNSLWTGSERSVLCQELGHALGIRDHLTTEPSCMAHGGIWPSPGEAGCAVLRQIYTQ